MTRVSVAAAWLLPFLLLLSSAVLSVSVQRQRLNAAAAAGQRASVGGLLPEIGKRPAFAFGFRNFLADLAWLSAVQVAGHRRMAPRDYDRLSVLINTVVDFDPRFAVPYFLGGLVLGDSRPHVPEAMNILERGRRRFPSDWRLPFYVGYLHYFSLGDPVSGGMVLQEASRLPGSPGYLPFLATRMLSEGREPDTAHAFLSGMLSQEADPARREVLERRLREVVVERDIQTLERAVAAYQEKTGTAPSNLGDLVVAGLIPSVPTEPHGGSYVLSPGGTVRSDRVTRRLKVFRPR